MQEAWITHSGDPEIYSFEISTMGTDRHLGFHGTGNSAIQSTDRENPTLEPNINCIGSPVAKIRSVGRQYIHTCIYTDPIFLLFATLGT